MEHVITAKKVWNKKGTVAKVIVTIDGIEQKPLGGARANRAKAVTIVQWVSAEEPHVYGLRSTVEGSQRDASAFLNGRQVQYRAKYALSVEIEEEVPATV